MHQEIIGGVEGGATHSTIVLLNADGNVIAKVVGPGTNHLLLGMVECRKRIAEMTVKAKKEGGIPEDVPLAALGLSLSGCEHEESNNELVRGFLESYPTLSERYAIGSDTQGSVAATSNKGGITCIAGTGSNTLLINPDGTKVQCGGWGFLLGDDGSAWKIVLRAVKLCYDDLDNYEKPPFSTKVTWEKVKEHFGVSSQEALLDHFYTRFDKARIAGLCKKLSACANDGDELCKFFFKEAGECLARALASVIPKAAPELSNRDGGLHILCVGSVWLSWNLLKCGFISWLENHTNIEELSLVRLTTTMAVGAAYMAADQLNINLPRTYESNYSVFFHFQRNETIIKENGN